MKLCCVTGRSSTIVLVCCAGAVLLTAAQGCKSDRKASAADEAKMRANMTKPFDINSVPPDKRDMVRGMMKANGVDPDKPTGTRTAVKTNPVNAVASPK